MDTVKEQLEGTASRRHVVTTGVKLAYAAPLVAASFKFGFGVQGADAASPVTAFCGHSVGTNEGCMGACTSSAPGDCQANGETCDGKDPEPANPLYGNGPCWYYCPGAQGDNNPCCNVGLCDPGNFICHVDLSNGNEYVEYIGSTVGCP